MHYFLRFLFLFMLGAVIGWIIELFFRRFVSMKKWINPGFLSGPYLPLYGFGLCVMYAVCRIPIDWWWKGLIISAMMTLIELIVGLIFTKIVKIKLWDYSKRPLNYKGIICIEFSLIWAALGIGFLFLIDPLFHAAANWFVSIPILLLPLGIFYGIFFTDIAASFNLAVKIRQSAIKAKELILYEYLKKYIAKQEKERSGKRQFLFSFRSPESISKNTERYIEMLKKELEAATDERIRKAVSELLLDKDSVNKSDDGKSAKENKE